MNPRKETIHILEDNGFLFMRHGGSHDIFFNPETRLTIPVKRHDFDEDDMRYILKEAKIDKKKMGKRKGK
ncbi:type II toxin-antitoxin system HicA family toxin [Pseudoflavonifractor sp. 524-17]|uniref:type II toxin-antitoxin system HicA family toxin n=1 Tax=Pseudoflavonifractor sp. 524-17 TaxID=2304577 RepID=UPI00137A5F85|nr:type II toxin-antitoxin system HicA family toxin [Pseudoflavonifractor sp. 524-17]NCE66059.1 type II toxin-antitoxin system HicA family toxin [Pseudoflavonifractor sp. 524-17]